MISVCGSLLKHALIKSIKLDDGDYHEEEENYYEDRDDYDYHDCDDDDKDEND